MKAKILLGLSLILSQTAQAASFCGRFDLLSMPVNEVRNVLDKESLAVIAGPKPVSCGVSGEDFKICRACEDRTTPAAWASAQLFLATPAHRLWHFRWHETAKNPIVPDDAEIAKLRDWKLLHDGESAADYAARSKANNGESFFFMHRQMIKMLHFELTAMGAPCIAGWSTLPDGPWDAKWPFPQAADAPEDDRDILTSQFNSVSREFHSYDDDKVLRSMTLNQLGERLQIGLHIMLHTVYELRTSEQAAHCTGDELQSTTCDLLGSNKSSHVNIHFWKLHGLIDDFVGRWLRANGYREIAVRCEGRSGCYEWRGTYLSHEVLFLRD